MKGRRGNPEAIGATVEVHAGGRVFQRLVRGGDSYLSVNDRRPLVGLGSAGKIDQVEIRWPGGRTTTLKDVAPRTTHEVVEPEAEGGESK